MTTGRFRRGTTGPLLTLVVSLDFVLFVALPREPTLAQDTVQALAARAEQFEALGKWDDAAAVYREILKITPRSIAALNRLGTICVRRQKFNEALAYYRHAQSLNPYEFGTNLNLGIAYIKMQDYARATTPLERATEAEPSDFQARELLGVALVGEDDYAAAIPQLEKAAELAPGARGTLYLLERSYRET